MIASFFKKLKGYVNGPLFEDEFSRKRPLDDSDDEDFNFSTFTSHPIKRNKIYSHLDIGNTNNNLQSNKDSISKRMKPHCSKQVVEDGSSEQELEFPSPAYSSFKFKPSVTSTVGRSLPLVNVSQRKPIRKDSPSERVLSLRNKSNIPDSNKIGKYKKISDIMKPFKAFCTPRESFRLEDKKRYRDLLQQYTSAEISRSLSRRRAIMAPAEFIDLSKDNGVSTRKGAIVKQANDPMETSKTRLRLEKDENFPLPSIPSHWLPIQPQFSPSKSFTKRKGQHIPVIDLEAESSSIENSVISPDDDIVITKEVLHKKPYKNSLEKRLCKSPFYEDNWLKDMKQFYSDKFRHVEEGIEELSIVKRQREKSRREECEKYLLNKVSKRISALDISFPDKVFEISEEEELPELTPDMEHVILRAFRGGSPAQVLADKFGLQITRKDIHTLAGLNWLNDEIINFYMNMLMERSKGGGYPSLYAFNTFFYSKLAKMGYSSVRRWTKKVDIFSHDLLIIPVHLGMHWCMASIDFRSKSINYYDSMSGDNYKCLADLEKYLESEHKDKKQSPFDVSTFSKQLVKDIPQQMNGSDCGMFSCKFAEYLSRDSPITFSQEHMPYFRRRMVYEIVTQKLL